MSGCYRQEDAEDEHARVVVRYGCLRCFFERLAVPVDKVELGGERLAVDRVLGAARVIGSPVHVKLEKAVGQSGRTTGDD